MGCVFFMKNWYGELVVRLAKLRFANTMALCFVKQLGSPNSRGPCV
jgi:hypothetical protein